MDHPTLDYRKPLPVLQEEWSDCEKCDLGVGRKEAGGAFVFGEGLPRGIMFVGEGPGAVEEEQGRPFVGPAGQVLRNTIKQLGLDRAYITNVVSCRSCAQAQNSEGQPIFRTDYKTKERYPLIADRAPNPMQAAACTPRLHEEIYLADPVIIVALGTEAAKVLTRGKPVRRGVVQPIEVPGAWQIPVLTEKKRVWLRKVRGELVQPTAQNMVRYSMIATWHPAYLLRNAKDKRYKNPVDEYVTHMKTAAKIYDEFMRLVHGVVIGEREITRDATLPPEEA